MEKEYWDNFYQKNDAPNEPSGFAKDSIAEFPSDSRILELGCGNGRDSLFFAQNGFKVFACDQSDQSIAKLKSQHPLNPTFFVEDIINFGKKLHDINIIYCRFVLHAISEDDLDKLLTWVYDFLPEEGLFISESRSDKSSLEETGKHFKPHFRRLLNKNDISDNLVDKGFLIKSLVEADNLANYKDENPFVIRLVVKK